MPVVNDAILICAALWAGMQNALAGGGSFVTLPALMLTGMDARAANITSTVALFPAQIVTGWTGRALVAGASGLSFKALVVLSLVGGALGALLLLITPSSFFEHLVPYLVLFATAVFTWGSFGGQRGASVRLGSLGTGVAQLIIAIYGGYFGGGIGFLMLAALTAAGMQLRAAGATKNVLSAVMNASAVAIFILSPQVHWTEAGITAAGAITGGLAGGVLMQRVNERALRVGIVMIGVALTVCLFLRAHGILFAHA
jgi:uncharacterized membrane protein YfcA